MLTDPEMIRETYRLSQENNKMLHSMRRNAFLGGILKLLIYAAIVIIPFWLYMQYLAPKVDRMLTVVNQIQGTSAQAQVQMNQWQKAFQDIRGMIPGMSSTSAN